MKSNDVVIQLQTKMPTLTDLFNSTVDIVSLEYAAGTVTATTGAPHNLISGRDVIISGALTPNPIINLTQTDDIAAAETQFDHDLTQNYQENIIVQGADNAEYNGEHPLLRVPNRRNFTYQISGDPPSPDTGSPILLEDKAFGYNGIFTITVISPTEFTYNLPYDVGTPAQGTITASFAVRISDSVSVDRAIDMYSQFNTDELWAFVVLNDVVVSKDRDILSDATETFKSGDDFLQREINPFSVFVFAPATFSLDGAIIRDLMEDVRVYLYHSLLGVKFPTYLSTDAHPNALYRTYTLGHSRFEYNGAFYIHQFDFESLSDIFYNDTVGPDLNVAFRDVNLSFINNQDPDNNEVIATASVDLDDEPLT